MLKSDDDDDDNDLGTLLENENLITNLFAVSYICMRILLVLENIWSIVNGTISCEL